jgi:uncharacterized membrane-anchored protein YhcB (DUF1043 family)
MNNLKDKILIGTILGLILVIIFLNFRSQRIQEKMYEQLQFANKEIVKLDTLKKERDGQYAKLVSYFESEKTLKESLREDNKELSKLVEAQNERILMLNQAVVSLEDAISKGEVDIDPTDSTIVKVNLTYPDSENPFINWNGKIFTDNLTYSGKWSFGSLPIEILLTETERGLWKSRLIGPDWLKVDSINVKSLPPSDIADDPNVDNFGILVGGGYMSSLDPNLGRGVSIGFGAQYKNSSLMLNYGSLGNYLGLSYYHRISLNKKP